MLVSVIIDNYNYGRYLRDCIQSALSQTYEHVEVIVVDDGSTDESRAIIAEFADRVVVVLKENGGQASAFNAGFAASTGEVLVFLDSDDTLEEDAVEKALRVMLDCPDVIKVQFRLAEIDKRGTRTGRVMPPWPEPLPVGDLGGRAKRYGPDIMRWPASNGCAFRREPLTRVFPMPEAAYRIGADGYLLYLSPFLGPFGAVNEVLGQCRIHGANSHLTPRLTLDWLESKDRMYLERIELFDEWMRREGAPNGLSAWSLPSLHVTHVACLALTGHLRLREVLPASVKAGRNVWRSRVLNLNRQLMYSAFLVAMLTLPSRARWRIAEWTLIPKTRPALLAHLSWI